METIQSRMSFTKTAVATALAAALAQSPSIEAAQLEFSFDGVWTYLDSAGDPVQNTSKPYYYDATWGYGFRTQVSGTLTYDTDTGLGTATMGSFEFFSGGSPNVYYDINLEAIGDGAGNPGNLILGNMLNDWNGNNNMPVSIVWDATGLLDNILNLGIGDSVSGVGAVPASNGIVSGTIPVGPAPVATTTWDTTPLCTPGSCLGVNPSGGLPLIADTIGGSPLIDGPFAGVFNNNFELTSLTLTACLADCASVPTKVGLLRSRQATAFSTTADPATLYQGLFTNVGNVIVQAKAHNFPIALGTTGTTLDWVEITNATSLPDGITSIRAYQQQVGGLEQLSLVTVTGGNTCTPSETCEESTGPDSFLTTRPALVNVAATALINDVPVRWQKFCTHVFNAGSGTVEPVCGHGKNIEID